MRIYLIAGICVLPFLARFRPHSSNYSYSYRQENVVSDTLFWNQNRKLRVADLRQRNTRGNTIAATFCRFNYNIYHTDDTAYVISRAYLLKNKSWIARGADSSSTLQHEQIHFDISEIEALLFQKYLHTKGYDSFPWTSRKKIRWKIMSIYLTFAINEVDFQDIYDFETQHGADSLMQKEWERRIGDEINYLHSFKK